MQTKKKLSLNKIFQKISETISSAKQKLSNAFNFFNIELDENGAPKVSQRIRTDEQMHVTVYCSNYPVLLPQWLRKDGVFRLTSITQLKNFPSSLRAKQT